MVKGTVVLKLKGFTLVEAIVAMVLSGVIFTGIMITSSITMERITNSMRTENEERQMDRFQLEIGYFLSRAQQYRIYTSKTGKENGGAIEAEGDYLECFPQDDPLEPTDITRIAFYFLPNGPGGEGSVRSGALVVEATVGAGSGVDPDPTGSTKVYTYSHNIQIPAGRTLFTRENNGWISYSWELDSGYGIESFSNRAIPQASL